MGKLFGTDGIRGIAGCDLTCELAMEVGKAAAYVLGKKEKQIVLIGTDTRFSAQMLSSSLAAGLMSMGADVIDLGIVPTPLISYLVKKYNATMGAMISASHNPYEYNGIKLFDNNGFKLSDDLENEIEKYLLGEKIPSSDKIGTKTICNEAVNDYVDCIVSTSKEIDTNLKIAVDCAYGSASVTAPILFKKLGFNVDIINNKYDGYNINDKAGSTHLDGLIDYVKQNNCELGIAYDGDADRCLMIDENGNIVDGDHILAISALALKSENKLLNNTLVGTVMSNLGLQKFCEEYNINFEKTKVGDRYVLENMIENNYNIGGEQSGHIIFKDYANTGDGELTSIQILNILSKEKTSLSKLASVIHKYPQVLINVKVRCGTKLEYQSDSFIKQEIEKVEKQLNNDGRVLVRTSGTEDLIRVMVEGSNYEDINEKANGIAKVIRKKYGI